MLIYIMFSYFSAFLVILCSCVCLFSSSFLFVCLEGGEPERRTIFIFFHGEGGEPERAGPYIIQKNCKLRHFPPQNCTKYMYDVVPESRLCAVGAWYLGGQKYACIRVFGWDWMHVRVHGCAYAA